MLHSNKWFKILVYVVLFGFYGSNLLLNRDGFENLFNTKKLALFSSFPMIYHFLNSDKWLTSCEQATTKKNKVKFVL